MEQISIDNLEDWPKDWDLHIVKAFSSYLPDNDGSRDVSFEAATFHVERFVSADYDIDKSTVSIVFKFKDKRWSGNFSYNESIFCELFYVVYSSCKKFFSGIFSCLSFRESAHPD